MGLQHDLSTSCTSESSPSYLKKKLILKKFKQTRDAAYSSSSSSPEVSKENTSNEKLFARECKGLQTNFNKSSDSNLLSSNSSDINEPQLQNERQFDFNDTDNEINVVSTEGVLHLKEPLINKKNESIFYESRGRMEPMDWSLVNDDKEADSIKKKIHVPQKKIKNVTTINQQSECKPESNPEFLNFVQNSATSKTIYEVRNNFERIHIDLPISILQRQLKISPKDSLLVTPKIKDAFKFSQSDIHLTNLIDKSIDKFIAVSRQESVLQKEPVSANNCDVSISKQSEYNLNGSKDLCEFDSKDSLSTLGFQNLANRERKIDIDKYDDDMFSFTKSTSKPRNMNEHDDKMFNFKKSSSKSNLYDDVNTVSPKKELHPVNKGLVTLSNSDSPSPRAQLYFNKLKNVRKTKLNYSLDSDDASLEISRQNDDLISKKSMTSNYEIFKNKLKNTSSQYSTMNSETRKIEQENKQKIEDINNKFMTKEMQTRDFIISNSNTFIKETNVVKISNIKIFPKAEPLLTAVSTRYFPKPLKKQEDNVKIQDVDEIAKNVGTIDILDACSAEMSTAINPNSSLFDNKSDSSQDLFLSFDNTSNDDIFAAITKNNDENSILSLDQRVTSTNVDELQDVASDKNKDDNPSIFYNCKCNDSTNTSVIIEKMDSSKILENENAISYSNSTGDNILALYEDIDSEEEFDFVNVDKFPPYSAIYNKLMEVKEAQKAIATKALDIEDSELNEAYIRYKQNDRAIDFDKSKSTESSLEISDNHYTSIDASISSNTESDYKALILDYPNLLQNTKDNIFANLKIDNIQLDNSILNYYGKKPEPKKVNILPNNTDRMSKRTNKVTDVLNKYRKNIKSNDTDQVKKVEKPVQLPSSMVLNSQKMSKRLQVLNQMKKRKIQLADNR